MTRRRRLLPALTARSFRSEAAESLRARLIKYRDKLFTFIDYDGVPWNNNNAENAIKQFAYYREQTNGMLRETGLRDYLVLLEHLSNLSLQRCQAFYISFSQSHETSICSARESTGSGHRPPLSFTPRGLHIITLTACSTRSG